MRTHRFKVLESSSIQQNPRLRNRIALMLPALHKTSEANSNGSMSQLLRSRTHINQTPPVIPKPLRVNSSPSINRVLRPRTHTSRTLKATINMSEINTASPLLSWPRHILQTHLVAPAILKPRMFRMRTSPLCSTSLVNTLPTTMVVMLPKQGLQMVILYSHSVFLLLDQCNGMDTERVEVENETCGSSILSYLAKTGCRI